MISIAMTAHNAKDYITEQLDSLRNQTRQADEVILVDDASSDGTLQIIERYLDEYALTNWKLIVNETSRGFIEAFRQAISLCHGQWIFLCDHDDRWKPDKIARMMETVPSCPDLRALFCSFERIDGQGTKLPDRSSRHRPNQQLIRRPLKTPPLEAIEYRDVAAYNVCQGCTMLISRELASQYLVQNHLHHLPHDHALALLAALQQGLYYLDAPLIDYRLHDANTLGLARTTQLEKRTADALAQAAARQEAFALARQYGNRREQALACRAARLFSKRATALEHKSALRLLALLPASLSFAGMSQTIGYDALLCVRGEKEGAA